MAYRKKTIRRLPPKTREFAKILNELESVLNRAKNRLPEIARLELDSQALINARQMLSLEPERKRIRKEKPSEQEELFPPEAGAQLVHALPEKKQRERKGKAKKTDESEASTAVETSPDSSPEPETETTEPQESDS